MVQRYCDLTEEQKISRRLYSRIYYQEHREELRRKQKIRYDNLTPEQRRKQNEYLKEYFRKYPEKRNSNRKHKNYTKNKLTTQEYYQKNAEKIKKYQRDRYRRLYGLIEKKNIEIKPIIKPLVKQIKPIVLDFD